MQTNMVVEAFDEGKQVSHGVLRKEVGGAVDALDSRVSCHANFLQKSSTAHDSSSTVIVRRFR